VWNYPFNATAQEVKKRWLILLGYFVIDEKIFVVTTTTRLRAPFHELTFSVFSARKESPLLGL
jgi:hypothetical protein